MEVTLRNGYNMVVFNGSLLGHTLEKTHCMVSLENYTENGIHCTSHNHDIVEVKFNGKVIYGRIEDSKYWSASEKVMHEIEDYHRHKKELDAFEVRIADLLELVEQANKLDINVCFKPEVRGVKLNG